MKISYCIHNKNPRWRVNIERRPFRKRLFFRSAERAYQFARAAQTPVRVGTGLPRFSPASEAEMAREDYRRLEP